MSKTLYQSFNMSRKISNSAAEALYNHVAFKSSNTKVTIDGDTAKLFLHGNLISIKRENKISITNAGWMSNVTKERLNALNGVSIRQKKGNWYLNGELWDGKLIPIN
jgi:hypothetical protein